MPLAKISTKHQITIPKEVFKALDLAAGDLIEVTIKNGEGRIIPQRVMARASVPKLSATEQKTLKSVRKKIETIANDKLNSRGLTKTEIKVAAKVGLIDPDQAYYWTEEWQKDEREAEQDIQNGDTLGPFDNIKDTLAALKSV